MEKRYVVRINGELVTVTEDVYRAYYTEARRERTQLERDIRNRLLYYDAWDTEKTSGAEIVQSSDPTPEDMVVGEMSAEKLRRCLKRLSVEEREIIHALFYCGETLSSLSRRLEIPRKTLEGRRDKILSKLRVYFEAPDR